MRWPGSSCNFTVSSWQTAVKPSICAVANRLPAGARFRRFAAAQKMIGQQIRFRQRDIRQLHAGIRNVGFRMNRFGALAQHARRVVVAQRQCAVRIAQVFEDLPIAIS